MARLDKEAILASVSNCIDVANASDDPPTYHLMCGGGPTVGQCQWFAVIAMSGTDLGEALRGMIAKKQATDPHFNHVKSRGHDLHVSSDQPIPPAPGT